MRSPSWFAAAACVWAGVAGADFPRGVVTQELLDEKSCGVWMDGKPVENEAASMRWALGLPAAVDRAERGWSAGSVTRESPSGVTFRYRIAFRVPVRVGSVLSAAQTVGLLKPEAPLPGDPDDAGHWVSAQVARGLPPRFATLATQIVTRAVLLTETRRTGRSVMGPIRVYEERFFDVAPLGGGRARAEYVPPKTVPGRPCRALDLVRGLGPWASAGKNDQGLILAPPVSEVHPQWLVVAWDAPRRLGGLRLDDNFARWTLQSHEGDSRITPLAGLDAEWRTLRPDEFRATEHQGRWVTFDPPLLTRGLRLRVTQVTAGREDPPNVALVKSLLAVEDLGPAPCPIVSFESEPPPFAVRYRAPQDGELTLVVDRADGGRVRNLLARTFRRGGDHAEPWDLLDEGGSRVAPGLYRWKLVTAPPLELRYEFTVYPNVSVHHPENSPWLNGHHGSGGWLADHTPPRAVCTSGEWVFFGAPTAESGVSFAACDLTGRKHWGIHSFAAWSGVRTMAADETTVFVEHLGQGHYGAADAGADRVWAIDIAGRQWRPLLVEPPTERRLRGISAMAARAGRLVLAVNAPDNWLDHAAGWADVDIEQCRPRYPPARQPRVPREIVPNERDDFLRLFRLKGDPPGYGHPSGSGLIWLESERGSERRQHLLLAFRRPVAVGCCVFPVPREAPYRVEVHALRPEAPYPPWPDRTEDWRRFDDAGRAAWDVAVAPPDTCTRALLVTFVRTGGLEEVWGDLLGTTEADVEAKTRYGSSGAVWCGRLEGMRILRRRFRNVTPEAAVRVNSGRVDKDGVWVANRTDPLSPERPAVYVLEWKDLRRLRGLAIKEIDGERTEIDVFTGSTEGPVSIEGTEGWEKVAEFVSRRRIKHPGVAGHNARALYLDGTVDFGREITTRAVRLRVVSQWLTDAREGSCAKDGLGLDPTRCRIFGVAALEYLGGEPPVNPVRAQRLEIVDGMTGRLEREVPIPAPTQLAFSPDGTLYAVADGRVVIADQDGGVHRPFPAAVKRPGALACDRHGNLFIYDAAPERRVIEIFDPQGTHLRTIGEPGGFRAGPWNPARFQNVTAIAVDREDKLWVVDHTLWPKRVSCWTIAGEFLREYLGPTEYGGGGVLDPGDRRRLLYGPLEFELDWETGRSRLKNLTWTGETPAGEVPVRIHGRLYHVTRGRFSRQTCGIVYLVENGRLKLTAAVGAAEAFAPLRRPAFLPVLGARTLESLEFIWTDRNGDGEVQPEETEFTPRRIGYLSDFDSSLNIQAGAAAFEVRGFLTHGAPLYEKVDYPLPVTNRQRDSLVFRLRNGTFYRFGAGPNVPEAGFDRQGHELWTWANEGAGVGPNRTCGPWAPGQVVCQFGVVGHEVASEGELGEFFVCHSNFGVWNLWTADGLLAGRMFRDLRDPRRVSWTMSEHSRGLRLDDVSVGEEHFNGWFMRSREDGRYYAVAGHNHASVVEVRGIERFRRAAGEFRVTPDDMAAIEEWARRATALQARTDPSVMEIAFLEAADLDRKWDLLPVIRRPLSSSVPDREMTFQMGRDRRNLYVRYSVRGAGPFRNTGQAWDRLFRSGAGVDLLLGLDPAADPGRHGPVAGDKRLLTAMFNGRPVVVLYEPVKPDAPASERGEVVSPVGRVAFDSVRRLSDARAVVSEEERGYWVELTIPLSCLGLTGDWTGRIRLDWGILETDEQGTSVLQRWYWANRAASVQSDAPSEARLEPRLWGWAILLGGGQGPSREQEATGSSRDRALNRLLDGL